MTAQFFAYNFVADFCLCSYIASFRMGRKKKSPSDDGGLSDQQFILDHPLTRKAAKELSNARGCVQIGGISNKRRNSLQELDLIAGVRWSFFTLPH